ncbi:MAG: hypothetical protein P8P22_03170 [Porticoccaceae bacterium]|nr:hypothetical protein [Porticoccaceae bacterium]
MAITLQQLTAFLGWCAAINAGILIFSTLMLMLTNRFVIGLHSRLFQVDPVSLPKLYFAWLGNYKILIIMFNLVPYLALRLIL